MKNWQSVTIVGVGLIGASIGLALRERKMAQRVVGVARRASTLRKAKQRGAVSSTTTSVARGVAEAELIVICTPVEFVVDQAIEAAAHCPTGTVITDVASTKAKIVAALSSRLANQEGAAFVGSHPMAGSEKTGPTHAQANLFQGRPAVVTPTTGTPPDALQTVERLWEGLGARVIRMTASDHDRSVAMISHLPHLIASALAATTPEEDLPLASTGWLDTTRIAGGDPELWRQILTDNREDVVKSLDKFERVLASFRRALEGHDAKKLIQLLQTGKQRRDALQ